MSVYAGHWLFQEWARRLCFRPFDPRFEAGHGRHRRASGVAGLFLCGALAIGAGSSPAEIAATGSKDAAALELVIAADPWCPHNCDPDSDRPGYMIELARRILGQAGIQVHYRTVAWARALELARQGEVGAVAGALRGDAPDFIFPAQAQGVAVQTFYAPLDSTWQYQGLDSLDEHRLVIINDYSYSPELDRYVTRHYRDPQRLLVLSGARPLRRAVALVKWDRADAMIEDAFVMAYLLRRQPELDYLKPIGALPYQPLYIAFSPELPEARAWAALLDQGMTELRRSGELAAILAEYGLRDWDSRATGTGQ